ncbi:hypothetical protein PGTUg99_037734 [Puccinia graminis f. sp. tritici]|uniref:YDG domain-containing protein n=1 Tax=Puccinia graminis f. sp. tritici TaxID=56615 RepID=A0A5B0RA62_PUCGR|nr:hypothetical protein PGTUg99_037734 [Puccinia graminis f. sp. tritici]
MFSFPPALPNPTQSTSTEPRPPPPAPSRPPTFTAISQPLISFSPKPSQQPPLDRTSRPNPQTFGHIPGVLPGQSWDKRSEVSQAGVHAPYQGGISGTEERGGAESVVLNDGYPDGDCGDIIWYMGSGGFRTPEGKKASIMQQDQKPDDRFNRSLQRSIATRNPIRVLRGPDAIHSPWAPAFGYRYDGLYQAMRSEIIKDPSGCTDFKCVIFRLERLERDRYAIPVKSGQLAKALEKANQGRNRKLEEDEGSNTPNNLLKRSKVSRPRDSSSSQPRPLPQRPPPSQPDPLRQPKPLQKPSNFHRTIEEPTIPLTHPTESTPRMRDILGQMKFQIVKPTVPADTGPQPPPAVPTQGHSRGTPSSHVPSATNSSAPSRSHSTTNLPARPPSPSRFHSADNASACARPNSPTRRERPRSPIRRELPPRSPSRRELPPRSPSRRELPPWSPSRRELPPWSPSRRVSRESPPPTSRSGAETGSRTFHSESHYRPPPTSRSGAETGSRTFHSESHYRDRRPPPSPHRSSFNPRSPPSHKASYARPYDRPSRSPRARSPSRYRPSSRRSSPRSEYPPPAYKDSAPIKSHSDTRHPVAARRRSSPPAPSISRTNHPLPHIPSPIHTGLKSPVQSSSLTQKGPEAEPPTPDTSSSLKFFFPAHPVFVQNYPSAQHRRPSNPGHNNKSSAVGSSNRSIDIRLDVVLSPLPCDDFVIRPDDHQNQVDHQTQAQQLNQTQADHQTRVDHQTQAQQPNPLQDVSDSPRSSPMSLDSDFPASSPDHSCNTSPTATHSPEVATKNITEPEIPRTAAGDPATPRSLCSEPDSAWVRMELEVDELDEAKPNIAAQCDDQPGSPMKQKENPSAGPTHGGLEINTQSLSEDIDMLNSPDDDEGTAHDGERHELKDEMFECELDDLESIWGKSDEADGPGVDDADRIRSKSGSEEHWSATKSSSDDHSVTGTEGTMVGNDDEDLDGFPIDLSLPVDWWDSEPKPKHPFDNLPVLWDHINATYTLAGFKLDIEDHISLDHS